MQQLSYAFDRTARVEEKCSKHINLLTHYQDDTLMDKKGQLIKIIKLAGLDFITKSEVLLDVYKNRRNSLLKNFTSEYAIYCWTVRRKTAEFPTGEFAPGFAQAVNEKYQRKIHETEMYHNDLYLALISKQPEGVIHKGFNIFKQLSHRVDKLAKQQYLAKRYQELNDMTAKVLSALSEYQPELLSTYRRNHIEFSEPLEFIGQLINFDSQRVPLQIANAAAYLPRKRLFFNRRAGTLEMRAADGSRKFAAMLAIKDYSPVTYQGMLDIFSALKMEYVITQSFRFYDRQAAKTKLRHQQLDMAQSKDESVSQTEQINEAFDEAASGEVGYGLHHFSLVCYADSQEELNKHIGTIIARFSDLDIVCVREDVACECMFWAQLPGNFAYIARDAEISTKNFAALASFHNYAVGKLAHNYWGPAVTVFETLSGSPYYFNFHYKDVGNFLVFGAMGSGKTVLVGFLILQSMKFGGKRVIFDKDRGLEILVRAMGGVYEVIKPGIATGFNPCQLDDTPENRKFLAVLLKKMLTVSDNELSASEMEVIEQAIQGMYRLDKSERQLSHLASFFGAKKQGSLRVRFDQWHSQGAHAWLFDNADDKLNLSPDVIGFDLGHILADEDCKTPALMYLTHRVTQSMEGERGMLFIDEGWKALSDDYFRNLIDDWSRTPRKKNNLFGLATQVANDTANHAISKSINESAFCKIFFPNPTADKKVYIDDFGLSEHEYELIKTLPDDQHFFLLNYGRSTNKQSVIIRANLSGLENEIAIISAREQSLQILDQIRAECGEDPEVWLPVFHERCKAGGLK